MDDPLETLPSHIDTFHNVGAVIDVGNMISPADTKRYVWDDLLASTNRDVIRVCRQLARCYASLHEGQKLLLDCWTHVSLLLEGLDILTHYLLRPQEIGASISAGMDLARSLCCIQLCLVHLIILSLRIAGHLVEDDNSASAKLAIRLDSEKWRQMASRRLLRSLDCLTVSSFPISLTPFRVQTLLLPDHFTCLIFL